MRNRIILLLIGFMCYAGMGNAQEDKTEKAVPAIVSDSVEVAAPDSTVQAVLMAADSVGVPEVKMKLAFKPNQKRSCSPWYRVWDRSITGNIGNYRSFTVA